MRVSTTWTSDSGKRRRGRPKETRRRTLLKEAKQLGKSMEELQNLAKDRERWKFLVVALHATQALMMMMMMMKEISKYQSQFPKWLPLFL